MNSFLTRIAAATTSILCIFGFVSAQNFEFRQRVATETVSDSFASTLAYDGNTMVAYSTSGYRVFVRSGNTWSQQAVLTPSDGLPGTQNRREVAIHSNTIVIGNPAITVGANANQGAAYVFVRDGGGAWSEQQRLTASDGLANDQLGWSVAISGDTILVSATRHATGGDVNRGAGYVFVRSGSTWTQQAKLVTPDRTFFLGQRAALHADTSVLTTSVSGMTDVFVFVRNGTAWSFQQKITVCEPSGPSGTQCSFGAAVSIEGNTLAVSNPSLNLDGVPTVGGVYIFTRSGTAWTQQQRLVPDTSVENTRFGTSVSLAGSTLAIGAPSDIGGGPGSLYIFGFAGGTWNRLQRLQIAGHTGVDLFGSRVAASGNGIFAVAPRDNFQPETPISAAYFYSRSAAPVPRAPFDFDGDTKTDIGIFRPGPAEWWISRSSDSNVFAAQFGTLGDLIAPGDYTGDGKSDVAIFRPSNGSWFILRSEDFSFYAFPFGTSGDVPVPADYDADSKADPAVFRPSTATWYIQRSTAGTHIEAFGTSGDQPVVADYDGDSKADIAIYRPSLGQWWISRSTSGVIAFEFGMSGDKPVQGDYTGDSKVDVAFWRPENGNWFVLRSEDNSFYAVPFGTATDVPSPGDYDGDGKYDPAVFRPSSATWFVNRSTAGTLIQPFGSTGDRPIPNAFVP